MKKRTRYLLILLGFIIFFALSPLLILYVGGLKPDFTNRRLIETGVLAVKTEPKKANLFLNGALRDSTPANIRFLKTGDYVVRISKVGFKDWSKRLSVEAGKVTWANGFLDNLYLLLDQPKQTVLSSGVSDFALAGSHLMYITPKSLTMTDIDHLDHTEQIAIPKQIVTITSTSHPLYFLMRGGGATIVLEHSTGHMYDVSSLVTDTSELDITPETSLLSLDKNILSNIDFFHNKKITLLKQIKAFQLLNDSLYYISTDVGTNILNFNSTKDLLANSAKGPNMIAKIPQFTKNNLMVTRQREILLVGDNTLYRMNATLDEITPEVQSWQFNKNTQHLTYSTTSELYYFDFGNAVPVLVTRNTGPIFSPAVHEATGYAFFFQNGHVTALEIDHRDHQNTYTLTTTTRPELLITDETAENLYILDNGVLKQLKIR